VLDIAVRIRPDDVCLVPERRMELTTEGGLDVVGGFEKVKAACKKLADAGIRVSLFIDPDVKQIDAAVNAGAPVVELHTGRYAEAKTPEEAAPELERIRQAARYAREKGLRVNAGHGLHYGNVQPIAAIDDFSELNIGHAIIAESVFIGLEAAVKEMKRLIAEAAGQ